MKKPLILFVHGLGGDPVATWGNFPGLLASDPDIGNQIDVASYQYPTMAIRRFWQKKSIRIQDLAKSIRTEIETRHRDANDIILVCHSMGGIICQKYLIEELNDQKEVRIKAVALYAVPTHGARAAKWGDWLSSEHWHLRQLRRDSDLLDSIRADWGRVRPQRKFSVVSIVGGQDSILSRELSADSQLRFIADKDHLTLVKPDTRNDLAYMILVQLVRDVFRLRSVAGHANPQSISAPATMADLSGRVLFDVYQPADEPYYFQRREDGLLAGNLANKNVWLFGPSGNGKTVSLLRTLYQAQRNFKIVSLGHYLGRDARGVFIALHDSLAALADGSAPIDPSADWPHIVEHVSQLLMRLAQQGMEWMLIEEMPLSSDDDFRELFSRLFALMMLHARQSSAKIVSLAFSSVNDPRVGFLETNRMAELLKVIRFSEWRSVDLEGLSSLIAHSLGFAIPNHQMTELVEEARGSPRFLKIFFTNYLNLRRFGQTPDPFHDALSVTKSEMWP